MDHSDVNDLINHLSNLSTLAEETETIANAAAAQKCSNIIDIINTVSTRRTINPQLLKRRESLPIFKRKDELIQALKNNQILIVIGQTGSGKTTQLTQYIVESGLAITGKVGCTQLRRMAAKAVAQRVAKEYGCKLGEEVGFTIRFENMTSANTKIQYLTDGILLRECLCDPLLSSFSAIILDESHERTVDTDVLLAVLRHISTKRPELKLIISSATLDSEKFSQYFFNAQIFEIDGRMYPVDVIYSPHLITENTYVDQAYHTVIRINERETPGDILVFMSGEDDIETLAEKLDLYIPSSLYDAPRLTINPVYASLPWEQQALIFEKAEPGYRKVIIATNIAETALTVDGIRYVVDSGFFKQKEWDSKKEMDVLKRIRISQAQATQRTGRAGRISPGKCYRLYTEYEYIHFPKGPVPEISRCSLTSAVLLLKRMGYNNLQEIKFIDEPPIETMEEAINELRIYEAIDKNGVITEIGHKMAGFPIEPNLSKMLIISEKLGCSEEILTIVAMVSVPEVFIRRKKFRNQADAAKAQFFTNYGDFVMLLEVYRKWALMNGDRKWCKDNFLNGRVLEQASQIREQLEEVMKKRNMRVNSCAGDMTSVLKSICSGFFQNLAYKYHGCKGNKFKYFTIPKKEDAFIHPGSALFKVHPQWVVYQKIVMTSKPFMRGVSPIELSWLKEYTPIYELGEASSIFLQF